MPKRDHTSRETGRETGSSARPQKISRSKPRFSFSTGKAGAGRRGRKSELATAVIGILAFVFVMWMVVTLS